MKIAAVLVILLAFAARLPAQNSLGLLSVEVDGKTLVSDSGNTAERDEVRIERTVRELPAARCVNVRVSNQSNHPVALGTARLLTIDWLPAVMWTGSPAAVFVAGDSTLTCHPCGPKAAREYAGSTVLALVPPDKGSAIVVGYLTAAAARPELKASYQPGRGMTVTAAQKLLDRKLPPGQTLDLDSVYIAQGSDPFAALDTYANAVAAVLRPRVTRPTALWCSWYAHRMDVSEDLVLANAAVAAKHFRPLGFEIMQLDHGWQAGDITGDWIVDRQSFPHGLKWLADELKSRYGLKLGLWIAPTDVAETSDLYKKHPDWVLKDGSGKPLVNWKWYWKPNPNCYELDVTKPAAAAYVRDTFARLTAEGSSYYKIDFIASSGGEGFFQSDPTVTRGWGNLLRAMRAIRDGAGNDAWIRYCQTPPLASAGLADSTIGGDDTLDAGVPGTFHVLRDNARSLAAGYWLNDRLYHREVCDMSARMQADVEEARVRLAIMTLAGCSISFSDELQHLPPSRIRMMQQCLPPGTGSARMRPVDLFDRDVPSIWHLHCKNDAEQWETVGLFNFEETPQARTVDFAALGLDPQAQNAVFEFWEERFHGLHQGSFTMTLPPHTSRILSIRPVTGSPQVIGTDMHMLQGVHELSAEKWDAATKTMSARCHRAPGLSGRVFIYVPDAFVPRFDFPLRDDSAHLTHIDGPLWAREVELADSPDLSWSVPFTAKK